jgi:26S proteasome regulatory subunit N4
MEVARSLMARKDSIQVDLDGQFAILSANNSTLHTPLVDPQGFPRADIDVYAVRHARVRVIELKNDMESVMNELAKALEGVYDPRNGGNVSENLRDSSIEPTGEASDDGKVFARVDGVAPGSPAAQAVCYYYFVLCP